MVRDLTPPTAPTGLHAIPTEGAGATAVAWTAATDNIAIGSYLVYLDGVLRARTTATAYAFSGLEPGSEHSVSVVAVDTSGNASPHTPGIYVVAAMPDVSEGAPPPAGSTDVVLNDHQYEIGGVVFGARTAYRVDKPFPFGLAEQETSDEPLESADGFGFGVDRYRGRTETADLHVLGPGTTVLAPSAWSVEESLSRLSAAWTFRDRAVPGARTRLRLKRPGREVMRVYGRPRRLEPELSRAVIGLVPVTLEWASDDPLLYADVEDLVSVSLRPASGPYGIQVPVLVPVFTRPPATRGSNVIVNRGTAPTPAVMRIPGPVVNPEVSLDSGARIALLFTVPAGQYLDVNTDPLRPSVLLGGTADRSGRLTSDSDFESFALPAGPSTVHYDSGTYDAATPPMTLRARSAWWT